MKFTKSVVLSFALLMATSLSAASSSGSLNLTQAVQLNGTQIQPGEYKVTWEGAGPDVKVSILKGHNVVVKASGQVKTLGSKFGSDAAVLQKHDNGQPTLTGVRFAGKAFAIEFSDEAASMKSGTSSN